MSKRKRKRTGSTLVSGKHAHKRRQVTAPEENWQSWDEHCRRIGTTWAAKTRELWDQIAPPNNGSTKSEKS